MKSYTIRHSSGFIVALHKLWILVLVEKRLKRKKNQEPGNEKKSRVTKGRQERSRKK